MLHAPASPDRGTARFVREAAAQAGRTALLLVGQGDALADGAVRRWPDWLEAEGLQALTVVESVPAAIDWTAGAAADNSTHD